MDKRRASGEDPSPLSLHSIFFGLSLPIKETDMMKFAFLTLHHYVPSPIVLN